MPVDTRVSPVPTTPGNTQAVLAERRHRYRGSHRVFVCIVDNEIVSNLVTSLGDEARIAQGHPGSLPRHLTYPLEADFVGEVARPHQCNRQTAHQHEEGHRAAKAFDLEIEKEYQRQPDDGG
jgi:hypothetical protein